MGWRACKILSHTSNIINSYTRRCDDDWCCGNGNANTEIAELFLLEPDGGGEGGEDMVLWD
jgi:hypothetical protein